MEQLPDLDLLGLGFNTLGEYSSKSCTEFRILEPLAEGGHGPYSHYGQEYEKPAGLTIIEGTPGQPSLTGTVSVFENTREVQNHFAAQAGVTGTYGSFSGQAEALYSSDTSSEQSVWYAFVQERLDGFTMTIVDPKPSKQWLDDPDVKAMLATPKFNPSKPDHFFTVFRKFGTHFVSQGTIGANLYYAATILRSVASDEQTVQTKLGVEYKAVALDSSGEASTDWSSLGTTWSSSRQVTLAATGGDEALLQPALDPTYGDSFSTAFTAWSSTVDKNPKMIDFGLTALSKLFSGQMASAIDDAITAYTDKGISVDATVVSMFDASGTIEVSGKNIEQQPGSGGGAQLVVVDASTLTELLNRTIYRPFGWQSDGDDPWGTLFQDTDRLPTEDYFCALTVFGISHFTCPTGQVAAWLKACGATLRAWPGVLDTYFGDKELLRAPPVAYAFIGRKSSNSLPGKGLEQIDSTSPGTPLVASVVTGLIPRPIGFVLPSEAVSATAAS